MWQTKGMAEKSDAELACAARQGSAAAFQELTRRYFGLVYTIALSRVRSRETAEDLAQEVFLRVFLQLDRLKHDAAFAGWLVKLTRNLALDWEARRQTASRLLPMVPIDETIMETEGAVEPDIREQIDRQRLEERVNDAISDLPPGQREIVMLYFSGNLTYREIGQKLGVHRTTVSRHVEETLARLRGVLGTVGPESRHVFAPRPAAAGRMVTVIAAATALSASARNSLAHAAADTIHLATAGPSVGILSAKAKAVAVAAATVLAVATGAGVYTVSQSVVPAAANSAAASESAATTAPGPIEGSWLSIVQGEHREERVMFTFYRNARGRIACNITSHVYGVEAHPADEVAWDGNTLTMRVDKFGVNTVGQMTNANTISGDHAIAPKPTEGRNGGARGGEPEKMTISMHRVQDSEVLTSASAVTLPPAALDNLVGTYAAGPTTQIRLQREGDALRAVGSDGIAQMVFPISHREFFLENDITRMIFEPQAGKVDRMTVRKKLGDKTYDRVLRRLP